MPRYTASTPPTGSGAVRATNIGALTRTGEQAKWSGVGAFGRGFDFAGQLAFRASQHRRALDDEIEGGTAMQKILGIADLIKKTAENYNPTLDEVMPDNPDYLKIGPTFHTDKRDELVEGWYKDFDKDANKVLNSIRSPKVRANLESWLLKNTPRLKNGTREAAGRVLQDFHVTEIDKLRVAAAENGDIEKADYYAGVMDEQNLISHRAAEAFKKNNKVIADTSITTMMAQAIMAQTGYQDAIEFVMAQDIDVDIKKDIVGDIKFEASQQKLAYDKQVAQIDANYLIKLRKEQLSEDEVTADLQAGRIDADLAKEYFGYIDAQIEERLKGLKELNYDTYDRLQVMVEDYDKDKVTQREVRKAISEATKRREITTTVAMKLRDRLATKDDPDDPMNRSDVKRGLGVFDDLERFEIEQAKKDEVGLEEIREIRLKYQKIKDEYERWIGSQEKLTEKIVQDKIEQMTEMETEGIVLSWFEKLMWSKGRRQLFGLVGTEEERLAKKRAKAGIGIKEISKILTPEIARQYLNLAGGDRKRAEELAKDAGYEW